MPFFEVLALLVATFPSRDLASPAPRRPDVGAGRAAPLELRRHLHELPDPDKDYLTDDTPAGPLTDDTPAGPVSSTEAPPPASTTYDASDLDYPTATSTTEFGKPLKAPAPGTFLAGLDMLLATLWACMIACVPLAFAILEARTITWSQVAMGFALFVWLFTGMYGFSHSIEFSSGHWEGTRSLSVAESVYFMAQIITTVGYGDIVPAFTGGRVFIAAYVLVTVCLIADMITEVQKIVIKRFRDYMQARWTAELRNDDDSLAHRIRWVPRGEKLPVARFWQALLIYLLFAGIGAVFYCTQRGENKDLFESIYMSIITLSTIGFGAFTADTETGMVFAAFWMVFGVAALVNLVAAFGGLMLAWKQKSRLRKPDHYREFINSCQHIRHDGQGKIDEYEFVRLAVLHCKLATLEDLTGIEERFGKLGPDVDDRVCLTKVKDDLLK